MAFLLRVLQTLLPIELKKNLLSKKTLTTDFPCEWGSGFKLHIFQDVIHKATHLAFVKGNLSTVAHPLVRVQSENFLGDTFPNPVDSSAKHMRTAFEAIEEEGVGVFRLYEKNHVGYECGRRR